MLRLRVLFAALCAIVLFPEEALAAHFRYGTIQWAVPDPQGAPNTVEFTVSYGILAGQPAADQEVDLDFGDGAQNGPVAGAIVGLASDSSGQTIEVREFSVTHAYASPGAFTAFFADCCRDAGLENGAGLDYRVDTNIDLQAGNTGGPVSGSPPIVQLQTGGTRTFTWPVIEPDGDPVACRFGSDAEVGFPNPLPIVPNPPGPGTGGQSPSLSDAPDGCTLTWDLVDAQENQRYVVHVIFESMHAGQVSTTALDLIVETVAAPPPSCTGGGVLYALADQPLDVLLTGTTAAMDPLTVTTVGLPAGATVLPGGTAMSPFENTLSWAPPITDLGKSRVILVNYTTPLSLTGTCFVAAHVTQCSAGAPCSTGLPGVCGEGLSDCQNGLTVCIPNALPGEQIETCDGLDEDCDGVIDNGKDCIDTDGDGLFDEQELAIGTDPLDADSDDDGALDGAEPAFGQDTDGDGLINALDPDSDNDAVLDGTEMGLDCMHPATDLKAKNCIADADPTTVTSPIDRDSDGGGMSDGAEDANRNGAIDMGETDPTVGHGADDASVIDTDGDGLSNLQEIALTSDPNDADTDDDGVPDGLEPNPSTDTDGDGFPNVRDSNSDNDGLRDGTEMGFDCSNEATDIEANRCVPDADMGATKTSPLLFDTDGGGVPDGLEDENRNGAVDGTERDPNDPTDDYLCDEDSDCGGLTSGVVCDVEAQTCIWGCRTPGNSCPNGLVCTAPDGTIGECVECVNDAECGMAEICDESTRTCVGVECTEDAQCGDAASGRICDDATGTCIDGCHVTGNGCPDRQACELVTATLGVCKPTGEPDEALVVTGGMRCAVRSENPPAGAGFWLSVALGSLLLARRRRK